MSQRGDSGRKVHRQKEGDDGYDLKSERKGPLEGRGVLSQAISESVRDDDTDVIGAEHQSEGCATIVRFSEFGKSGGNDLGYGKPGSTPPSV
jgi:hypothetical protein